MEYALYALIAMLLFGLSRIMYIRASAQSAAAEQSFLLPLYVTGALLLLPIGLLEKVSLGDILSGLLLASLSLTGAVSLYRALRVSSPSIVNVIIGLNFLIPVAYGLVALQERLTPIQLAGLALALAVIGVSTFGELKTVKRPLIQSKLSGIAYTMLTFLTWGLLGVAVRVLSDLKLMLNITATLGLMYLFATLLMLAARQVQSHVILRDKKNIVRGVAAGVLGATGSLLSAYCYAYGNITITALILRFSYIVPVTYAILALREKVDLIKTATLALSIPAVILLTM